MALFTHEDFIILGMLFAKYFKAYIYSFKDGAYGGGGYVGGGKGWLNNNYIEKASTGRGGILTGNLADGDNGRPGVTDNISGPNKVSLCGLKGTISGPGDGLNAGGFGFGGRAHLNNTAAMTISAGGGSGWFGGGSAFIDAGGGGGSNFCYSNNELSNEGIKAANYEGVYEPPSWLPPGLWVGVDYDTLQHYSENVELYDTNTYHTVEYAQYKKSLGPAYNKYIELRHRADGNGLVLISKVNELIRINRVTGEIDGIDEIVEYSGQAYNWSPKEEGNYHFILWGAQGGTSMYTPKDFDPELAFQQYTGGFGGAIGGIFYLTPTHLEFNNETLEEEEVTTEFSIYVGERGNGVRYYNPWNGGGNGDGNCTSGGGSTDIRWHSTSSPGSWQGYFNKRFIVAGGGGGCLGSGGGGQNSIPKPPFKDYSSLNNLGNEEGEIDLTEGDELPLFLVNDRSLVYVKIKYFTQVELPENYDLGCTIYLQSGTEGVLYQDFKVNGGSGVIELVYPLDQVYKKNTETHWITITAKLKTNIMFVIPDKGLEIRVETRADVNESTFNTDKNKMPIIKRNIDKLKLLDLHRLMIEEAPGDTKVSYYDKFNLLDTYKIHLEAVELLKLSIIETFNLSDINNIGYESAPIIGDLLLSNIDKINLLDKVKTLIKEIEQSKLDNGIDNVTVKDVNRLHMIEVSNLKISIIETLGLNDTVKADIIDVE